MYGLNPLVFVSPSFVTNSLGPNDPKVGDTLANGNELYRFVYNTGSSTANVGDSVVVSAVSGYSVTVSSTTSVDLCIGVVKHAAIATGYYGYVVTQGFSQVNMGADLSAAAGALLILAADGKLSAKTISTGYVGPVVGKAMQAIASGASGTAYISVL